MKRDIEGQIKGVEVNRLKHRSDNYVCYYEYKGKADAVILALAEKLKKDDWTMMYDHMQLTIDSIEFESLGNQLRVVTRKSSFAGD